MSEPEPDRLLCEQRGAVRIITLNRPDRANSIDAVQSLRMAESLLEADRDDTVRAIVLTGAGPRHFCAGGDLRSMSELAQTQRPRGPMDSHLRTAFEVLGDLRKPVIAAINGAAIGGGFELALACDLRVADAHATFQFPEVLRGMGAHYGSIVLPRLLPQAIALELLLTCATWDAAEAQRWGLLNRVTEVGGCVEAAIGLATQIARGAPLSVRRIKANAIRTTGMPLAAALRLDPGPSPYESDDRIEGMRAFVEKREPEWKGR